MNATGTIAAIIGVMAAGIIYGTDVFCAIVQRPALTKVDDATAAAVMGRVHQYGDRRLPVPGILGILAAAVTTVDRAVSGSPAAVITAGIALIAMLAWLRLYLHVAAPVNRALTAAAVAGVTPANSRSLQARWDSVITPRALLMAIAVAGLAASAATS